jgi:light-regulated signal transduction histidine kinase (bacteriophytochrome)
MLVAVWKVLLDALPAAVALLDGGGRPVVTNAEWKRIVVRGHPWPLTERYPFLAEKTGLWNAAAAAQVEAGLADVLAGRRDMFQEEVAVAANSHGSGWQRVQILPVDRASFDGAVAMHIDVTEQHRLSDSLLDQKISLEETNRELERFVYVASHDLQEPLRTVASFVQLLARRYKGRLDANADEIIDFAVSGAKRMSALILDLLSYSRLTGTHHHVAEVDLGEVVREVLKGLDTLVSEVEADIVVRPLPTVLADPVRLTSLMQNLIGNALKYRHPDRRSRVEVFAVSDGDALTVTVADNGIGIDPAYHTKVFEMFERLFPHDGRDGTGIGLAIAQRIVESYGGCIWVESVEGHGSTFQFTLPAGMMSAG